MPSHLCAKTPRQKIQSMKARQSLQNFGSKTILALPVCLYVHFVYFTPAILAQPIQTAL
jgi:hypothetical protein